MKKKINDISTLIGNDHAAYISFLPLESFDWLRAGFSTRIGGDGSGMFDGLNLGFGRGDSDETVWKNWRYLGDLAGFEPGCIVFPNQQHTTELRAVDERDRSGGTPPNLSFPIDGQITMSRDTVLISYGADCPSIYLIDPEHHAVGMCHSGWKGTLNSISEKAIRLMTDTYGTDPARTCAFIGPSICMDNYEVGIDVAGSFIEKHGIDVTADSAVVKAGKREGKYQLDLWEANRRNLIAAGLDEGNIHISGLCTFGIEELFYSHRRTGTARGAMAGFIVIRE